MARKGLGKGLGALFEQADVRMENEKEQVFEIDINDISPQEDQPRKHFDEESLLELANSIKENGVIQPIILYKKATKDYILVAGERRWRAARLAGLRKIPAIIRDFKDEELLRIALIENIQREDLNPIEEAVAYQQLIDRYQMTQEDLAQVLGKSRSAVANTLRLNNLAEIVRGYLIEGKLSEGHGRALLSIRDKEVQAKIAETIIEKGLNVRQTEAYVRLFSAEKETAAPPSNKEIQYALSVKEVEEKISKAIGVKIKLKDRAGKGKIEIPYKNLDELDRLIELLTGI